MATIEPRLIHLLNDSQTPHLPPIPDRPAPVDAAASGLPLFIPPINQAIGDEGHPAPAARLENDFSTDSAGRLTGPGRPLQLLLAGPETNLSTFLPRMWTPPPFDDTSTRREQRAPTTENDFVQLPPPLKKQNSTRQVVGIPPIINGLHQPPPNAAVFPPISSNWEIPGLTFLMFKRNPPARRTSAGGRTGPGPRPVTGARTGAGAGAGTGTGTGAGAGTAAGAVTGVGVGTGVVARTGAAPRRGVDKRNRGKRGHATKPRRKWSEEETNHLMLGVSRHGVGKWTSVLEDPDFKFNDRSAGDLKDRFRTCCPDEMLGKLQENDRGQNDEAWMLKEGFEFDTDTDAEPAGQKKNRAHRKNLKDLAKLGIREPFKKSHRRERRPFTEQDDKEILDGINHCGPAWTKIQRYPRYNLLERRPTDLRDRVRNKYPEIYSNIEQGNLPVKDVVNECGGSDCVLQLSISEIVIHLLNSIISGGSSSCHGRSVRRSSSKDDVSRSSVYDGATSCEAADSPRPHADLCDADETSRSFVNAAAPEMDIGRLSLNDAQAGSTEPPSGNGYDGLFGRDSPFDIGGGQLSFTQMLNDI